MPISENSKEIPPYPDEGIIFAGHAKKFLGNNQYRILNQKFYNKNTIFGWAASAAQLTISTELQDSQNIFVTSLSLTGYSDTDCYFRITQYQSNQTICYFAIKSNTSNSITINFNSPLKITDISYGILPNVAVTGRISMQFTGFYEDKV